MTEHSEKLVEHFRRAGWLPISDEALEEWTGDMAAKVTHPDHLKTFPVLPEIQEFKALIDSDSQLYMGLHQMFNDKATPLAKHIPHYDRMLQILNKLLQEAPSYGDIGPPVFMLLSHAMNTQFDKWGNFLASPDSRYVLSADDKGGWFGKPAVTALAEHFDGLRFEECFVCDPDAEYYGFTSWDKFFTRSLRPGVRPIELPDNPDIISAPCEAQLYNIAKNVKEQDTFWLKGEPYSLRDMLHHDEYAPQFEGGTVFQGFLQVTGYHRWHAPAAGVVRKIVAVPGTYFCQSPATIGQSKHSNPYIHSLAFLTSMNTRLLIFIEADNPRIGLFCFIAVGMAEVSATEATVAEGQRVARGDELGMFHFGGSTHVLIFRPETNLQFFDGFNKQGDVVKVRAAIAGVVT
ncbi:phosphatidylserine decarboxylase [Mycena galericulata]|nr:phosphatidylserine decarboxylase [Mycena galericulata]